MSESVTFPAFLRALAPEGRPETATLDTPEVRALVSSAIERADKEVGELGFDPATFAAELGRAARSADDVVVFLRDVRAGELQLTRACAAGDPRALERLENDYFGEISRALGRVRADISREDFAQMVRERLYVAPQPGKAPRIAEFTGRGDLRTWLRVTITRTLLNVAARRREERTGDDGLLDVLPALEADPELELMKRRYAGELREAFSVSAAELSARERTLLRHAVIDKLSIDAIASIYGVHRATAARWVNAASDVLRERVAQELASRLRIDRDELKNVLRMIESRLDVSVRRCLERSG
jgi:RNA polymerase sigma-70 factor (ECF subfamily)